LGLVYHGDVELLQASTRNGATLKLEGPVVEVLRKKLGLTKFDLKALVKSRYWGWVLSRLYQDSWVSPKYPEEIWCLPSVDTTYYDDLERTYSRIHSLSVDSYLMGYLNWVDPRDGMQVTRTNKSSVLCNWFLSERWGNVPSCPRNEYHRLFKDCHNVNLRPLIIRGNKLYIAGRLFRDWSDFRKCLHYSKSPIKTLFEWNKLCPGTLEYRVRRV